MFVTSTNYFSNDRRRSLTRPYIISEEAGYRSKHVILFRLHCFCRNSIFKMHGMKLSVSGVCYMASGSMKYF